MTTRYGTPERLELFAPAKINLGLAVTGKLENGYHTLDTLFTTLDVGDKITLENTDSGISLEVTGSNLPAGPENLVYRAAKQYLELSGITRGVKIHLEKRLPIAAGLGGGSSDAATTLLGVSRLYPSDVNLPVLAKSLGADVPFFLEGGARHAQGIGEILEPVSLPTVHLVLANPSVGITAREAYIGLRGRFGPPLDLHGILAALDRGDAPPYRNDLEIPVLEHYPIIAQVKRALADAGLHGVLMSGSGSTCFGLARDATHARDTAATLQLEHPDWWIRAAQTT
jgi:4-diphosphocytidyl-2-C-methyl-D-erythritol kinase